MAEQTFMDYLSQRMMTPRGLQRIHRPSGNSLIDRILRMGSSTKDAMPLVSGNGMNGTSYAEVFTLYDLKEGFRTRPGYDSKKDVSRLNRKLRKLAREYYGQDYCNYDFSETYWSKNFVSVWVRRK